MPVTKHNYIIKDVEELAPAIRKAFHIARSGRPGPVLIDVTKDVTANKTEYEYQKPMEVERKTDTIREEDIAQAAAMIAKAKRPFIFVGGGAVLSGASAEVG